MLGNIIATGIIIFLGFWFLLMKLPLITKLKLLGRPFMLDLAISVTVFVMYAGSTTGLLAASFAALILSLSISSARRGVGYISENRYYLGRINLTDKLKAAYADRRMHR